MNDDNPLGQIVYSKAGRDQGEYYIVVGLLNEDYVYICNGRTRRIEKPKKKKCKHLVFTGTYSEEIKEAILNGNCISNSKVKNSLDCLQPNKEV
ncbi:hypothetical protein SAMN02745248_02635 [Hathewaya proteolytica DSM 3090]|uniref:Ribosomal protein L14E/L6E/L27E n=1 Tax=Hathewaya proteolytica DSM 3090 TaxID=1121331 RepID=A0A1M6STD2_9CLOT|nr:KOW domain-containing RNA-binding protein [Hathewaya proteolytica]SHK47916.1 hypothetical protein SAMN02745248_02635 [Hathewaya proteolytica DSM 3090]